MLQMVAMPVHERLSVPGPWYSTIAPVPPLTVRMPATLRMMSENIIRCLLFRHCEDIRSNSSHCSSNLVASGKKVHTFGGSPAGQLAGELDTNDLGGLQFPRKTSHDVDGVSTTNTNGGHTKTSSIGSVRVGTDQEGTGESVVLEHDLVDDTRAGLPEANVVLCARGGQEVVDFLVDLVCAGQILLTADLSLDKMVTVYGGGGSNGGHACRHELEDGHLGGGILASYTIGAQLEIAGAALNLLAVGVVQMRVEDLLGEGERAVQALAHDLEVLAHLLVVDVVALLPIGHFDLAGEGSIADGGQLPARSKALANAAEPRELLHGDGLGGWSGEERGWGGVEGKERQKLPQAGR